MHDKNLKTAAITLAKHRGLKHFEFGQPYSPSSEEAKAISDAEVVLGTLGCDPLRPISRLLRDDMVFQANLSPEGRFVCTIDRKLWNDWAEAIGDLAVPVTETSNG